MEDYHRIIMRLTDLRMGRMDNGGPKVINGKFGGRKNKAKQRLIIDARNANMVLEKLPQVELLNPGRIEDFLIES